MGLTLLKVEVNTLDVLRWTLFYLHSALSVSVRAGVCHEFCREILRQQKGLRGYGVYAK